MAEKSSPPGDFSDRTRADYEAALMIAGLKYVVLGEEEFKELQELVERTKTSKFSIESSFISSRCSSPVEEYDPPAIPPVPSIQAFIGKCSKPFQKQLTESDVREDQSRVSFNKEYVERYLVPLFVAGESLECGIPVTVYDRNGNAFPMMFKIWSGKTYVLNGGWKKFCAAQNFVKLQDFITVWMFRHVRTLKLCFVITSRRLMVNEAILPRRNGKKSKQEV